MIVECPDLAAMADLGERIADQLKPGDVVALSGDLGAGKSTLARAILKGLGYDREVPSPTFSILEHYDDPAMRVACVHADFYRLDHPDEAREVGLDDYRDEAVLIAEWPDNAGGFAHLPECLSVSLEIVGQGRRAIVEQGSDWLKRKL